jgi:hypothetical protein
MDTALRVDCENARPVSYSICRYRAALAIPGLNSGGPLCLSPIKIPDITEKRKNLPAIPAEVNLDVDLYEYRDTALFIK